MDGVWGYGGAWDGIVTAHSLSTDERLGKGSDLTAFCAEGISI
jgi:hypothetical protein